MKNNTFTFTVLLLLLLFILHPTLYSQKDWNGSVDDNWSTAANWTPLGVPTATDEVTVPNGFDVTVDVNAFCAKLTLAGGDQDNTLSINTGDTLNVTGEVVLEAGTQSSMMGDDKIIAVGDGVLYCDSISMASTTHNRIDCEITIGTGRVEVTGKIEMNGTAARNAVRFLDKGILVVGGDVTGGSLDPGFSSPPNAGPIQSTVIYNGSGPQNVRGGTYHALLFDGGGEKTLDEEVRVRSLCIFGDGIINTTKTNTLTFEDGANWWGLNDDSFVDGPVTKEGKMVFVFPIGKKGIGPMPLSISDPLEVTTFVAEYFHATPIAGSLEAGIDHISSIEYWTLERTAGSSDVSVGLSWRESSVVTDPDKLVIAYYDALTSKWLNLGNKITSGDADEGDITSSSTVSAYGTFTLASIEAAPTNPLPVELIAFSGVLKDDRVILNWSTATELNNDYFMVERSADGRQFAALGKVMGAGNSDRVLHYEMEDLQPYPGRSYYRLKQVDFDGRTAYSHSVAINRTAPVGDLQLFPNPSDGKELRIRLDHTDLEDLDLLVVATSGQQMHRENIPFLAAGENYVWQPTRTLPAGMYLVILKSEAGILGQQRLVVVD